MEILQENWEPLVKLAVFALSLSGGAATVPLIARIKTAFNWSGRKVQVLTVFMAFGVAVLNLVVIGVLSPEPATFASLTEILILILIASQAEYNRIKNR